MLEGQCFDNHAHLDVTELKRDENELVYFPEE